MGWATTVVGAPGFLIFGVLAAAIPPGATQVIPRTSITATTTVNAPCPALFSHRGGLLTVASVGPAMAPFIFIPQTVPQAMLNR